MPKRSTRMLNPSLPAVLGGTPWFGRFDLDIGLAIADQLGSFLEGLNPEPLSNSAALAGLPTQGGVYTLHHGGGAVYVGKAKSLRARLTQHASDFDGRRNISRDAVGFACAELSRNWAPFGAENILMARAQYAWQNSGFGNNDPGRNRESSRIKAKHWDAQFPIRLEWSCKEVPAGSYNAADLLIRLKQTLPFVLRFERADPEGHGPPPAEVQAAIVDVPDAAMPFWDIMRLIVAALPGWQATALPGYAIFYREFVDYRSALDTLR